jgi:hypothetical protein
MESALKLYQTKSVDGSWDKLTNDQKQAINLMAQFNSFKSKYTPTPSKVQGGKNDSHQSTSEERMKKAYDAAPDWKNKKPDDINAPHIEGDKTFYWCPKHQMFTVHKPVECKLPKCNNFYQASKKNNNKNGSKKGSKNGGKKGTGKGNSDKVKPDSDGEKKLQYTGTTNMGIDQEYGDY